MMRVRQLLVCSLVLLASLAVANADCTPVSTAESGWTIQFVNVTYDATQQTTTFTYTVTTGSHDLSHVVISPVGCGNSAPALVDDFNWEDLTASHDHFGKSGYRSAFGQAANTSATLQLSLHGAVNFDNTAQAVLEGFLSGIGQAATTAQVAGPACGSGYTPQVTAICDSAPFNVHQADCANAPLGAPASIPTGWAFSGDVITPGRCDGEYTLAKTYVTAVHGSTFAFTTCTQTVQVSDQHPPVVTFTNGDSAYIVLNCTAAEPVLPQVSVSDNCDSNPVLNYCNETSKGACPNNYFVVRSWTATDKCGLSTCKTQTIVYVDHDAPKFVTHPADVTLECSASTRPSNIADILAAHAQTPTTDDDNGCGAAGINGPHLSTKTRPGDCGLDTFELINTWTVSDECGNTNTVSQKITVTDTRAPELKFDHDYVPGGTYECDKVPPPADVLYRDDCLTGGVWVALPPGNFKETRHNGSCPDDYFLFREWSFTDNCGNCVKLNETITILDLTPPVWNQNLTTTKSVQCFEVPPRDYPTANDNCGTVTYDYNEVRHNTTCENEYVLVRTYTATDACSNPVVQTQTITVFDNTPTKIDTSKLPSKLNYQCAADVPTANSELGSVIALPCNIIGCENCDWSATPSATDVNSTKPCANHFNITRTYTLTDCSNNTDNVPVTIQVSDTQSPVIDETQLTILRNTPFFECSNLPTIPNLPVTDNCDDLSPIVPTSQTDNLGCEFSYRTTYTWSVQDGCGNPASVSVPVRINDTTAPDFDHTLPATVNLQCEDALPMDNLTATDNCAAVSKVVVNNSIPWQYTYSRASEGCFNEYTVLKTWTATDSCGNVKTVTQTIVVKDDTAPTLTGVPGDVTVDCSNIPVPPPVCASDNCNGVTVTYKQERTDDNTCANHIFYRLKRTWTACDQCGRCTSQSQTISVTDTTAPTTPSQINLSGPCDDLSWFPQAPVWTDDCNTFTTGSTTNTYGGGCQNNYTLQRTYTATDLCGNTATLVYNLTVFDNKTPYFTDFPQDESDYCTLPPAPTVVGKDDCSTFAISGPVDVTSGQHCDHNFTVSRTWTITDQCLNTFARTQVVHVYDDKAPVLNPVTPVTLECIADLVLTHPGASDCSSNLTPGFVDINYNSPCPNRVSFTRVWNSTDNCGNTGFASQPVTVNDQSPPTISGDFPLTVSDFCSAPAPPSVCAQDNCAGVWINFTETRTEHASTPGCSYTLLRSWWSTDVCGQTSNTITQTVTVNDNQKPEFVWPSQPPANGSVTTITCAAPPKIVPTARDNCGLAVTVTDNSHHDGTGCPYDYTEVYSFTITDHCGNTDTYTWSYKVTSLDLQITWPNGEPQSTTQTCSVIPPWEMPSVKDGCGGADYTVTNYTDLSETDGCSDIYKINRRWEIVDSCGHHHTFVQNLTGTHTVPPTWTFVPSDIGSQNTHCGETVTPQTPYGRDMCNRVITISTEGSFPDTTVKDADCPSFDRTDRYKWVGTDVCGLQIRTQADVDYCDCQPPTVIAPNDRTFTDVCARQAPLPPSVNDNCQLGAIPWTVVNDTQMSCPWIGTVTFTYTAYDLCGATSTDVAVDTYVQTAEGLPYFTVAPQDVTLNCDELIPTLEAKAVDRCLNNIPLTKTVNTHHDCDNIYQINRTWTGTDVCGNPISHTQHIRVLDPYGPTFINKPASALTVQCGLVPAPPTLLATSVCPGVNVTLHTDIVNGSHCCNYTITHTWTATTQCGKQDTFTQTITVVNTLPIPLPPIPPNQDQDCDNDTFVTFPVAFKYPPLAEGLCADDFVGSDDCTSPASPHFVYDQFVIAVPNSGPYPTSVNHLVLEYTAVVPIIADGVAQLQLVVKNQGGQVEDWHLTLQGFTPFANLGSYQPEQLLLPSCYSGSNGVDISQWYYYASVNGTYSGATGGVSVTPGKFAQYGVGAAGYNKQQGLTLFVRYTSASDNSVVDRVLHVALKFEGATTQTGTCAFDHASFPSLESQEGQLETHYRNWTNYTFGESCRYDYTFHEEWCSCDCSTGGRVCAERTIRVHDDYNPTIHIIAPAGQTGTDYEYTTACAEVVPPQVTTDHPCHTNITLAYETVVDRNVTVTRSDGATLVCDGHYTVHITATDECSKVSTASYTVTQYDHTAPDLTITPPTQPFFQCSVPEPVPATSYDSCGVATPNGYTVTKDKTAGSCPYDFSYKYTYNVEDWCGLSTTKSYTVQAKDITLPTYELTNYPADGTLECRAAYTPNVVGQDNCDANPTVEVPIIGTQFANASCTSFLNTTTYRISVTDVCGLTNSTTFAVTWVDTIAPAFVPSTLPSDATVSCDAVPPPAVVQATDSCDLMYIKFEEKHTDNDNDNCANSYVITRTWTAYDCAGNTAVHVQTITVEDHTAPTLDATPANVEDPTGTLCIAVPPPASRCASDNCAAITLDFAQTINWDDASNTACKRYTLNRTYTATDDCDNVASDWYTVRVYDNAPPTWDNPAENPPAELACDNPDGFIPTEPTATDVCSGVKYYKESFNTANGCTFNYTRNWKFEAYDNCLQPVWRNYSVRIRDVYQPVISGQPQDQTLECNAALPGRVAVMTHKCFNDVTNNLNYEDVSSNFNPKCAGMHTVTRTYYGQDDCGLKADNVTVVFTFNDSTIPFWVTSDLPTDLTVQCDKVPPADVLVAADDCTPDVPVIYSHEETPSGECNNKYTITRTWTATDCNGNFIKHVQIIHVIDTTAPQIDATPANVVNASCNAVPIPASRCVSDNCDGVSLVYHQSRTDYQGPSCNQYYLNRTYSVSDDCSNTVSDWYTVGVWDSVAPVFVPASPDAAGESANSYTCEVEATTAAPAPTSYSDDCNANSDVTYGQAQPFPAVTVSGTCEFNKTKVYTYTAADACGNTATWSKTYTFYDTTAPHFVSTPSPRSFYCHYGAAPVPPTASDNCALDTNISVVQSLYVNPGLTQTGDDCPNYTVQWGWYAQDTCGNRVYTYVNDTVYDNEAPQWDEVPPATMTFNCSDDIVMPTLTAHDCTNVKITTNNSGPIYDISATCTNTYHIIWEWWATDACGHVNYTKTVVTVVDQIKPVISDVPAGQDVITVECTAVPAPPSMCCNDNCAGLNLDHNQDHLNSTTCSSVYNLTRSWTCVDSCGNNAEPQNQLVIVQDTKAPVFQSSAYTLQDYQLECHLDAFVDYTATDACTGAHVDKHYDLNNGSCLHNYTVTRFWTATDDCGNSVVVNQTVTVADTVFPTISAIPGLCLYQPDYYPYIRLGDFTRNGTVFTFDDTCSTVSVIPRSCVSSQTNPADSGTHASGFSDDCYYDAATDSMVIHSVIYNYPHDHSRNFTIYVVARDECGHETPSEFSLQLSLGDECGPRTFCALSCPLPVGPVFTAPNYSTSVDGFSAYNPTADTTTFTYNVTWFSDVDKQSFVVGADFSQFVLVSANPDNNWKLGPTVGALVNGISWNLPSSSVSGFVSSTFSFTVKGQVTIAQVPVQVGDILATGDSEYSLVSLATGPVAPALFIGSTIAGSVAVDRVSLQSAAASTPFSFPVAYAAVALYLPGQAPIAYTLTDVNGIFKFTGYVAGAYKVALLQEGSLTTSTLVNSQPANWLSNALRNGDNFPRFSPDAPTSSSVAFHLTVSTNPLLHPYYAVTQLATGAPHFFGNARNVEWWKQQFLRTRYYGNVLSSSSSYASYSWNRDFLGGQLTARTDAYVLARCPAALWTASSLLSSVGSYDQALGAALLNHLSGKGFFEPYDVLQTIFLEYAIAVKCAGVAPGTDNFVQAETFLGYINDANGMPSTAGASCSSTDPFQ